MKKNNFILVALLFIAFFSCEKDEVKETPIEKSISSIAFDNTQTMWVGTSEGLFKSVNSGYEKVDYNSAYSVNALFYESQNNLLWIGANIGVMKLPLEGGNIELVADVNWSNKNVNNIYIDSNKNWWFGTQTGIMRNMDATWQKDKFKKNLSGVISNLALEDVGVNSIASWDGDYYFATNGEFLYKTSGWDESVDGFSGATQWIPPYNGNALSEIMYIVFVDSKGNHWMAGTEGLQKHTGHSSKENIIEYSDKLVNAKVHAIAEAPNGDIWFGTENGISIFDGSNWTSPSIQMPDNFVNAIAFDGAGKVCIGTKQGLVKYDL
jgi:ligand-binding sensor domain-containing protein